VERAQAEMLAAMPGEAHVTRHDVDQGEPRLELFERDGPLVSHRRRYATVGR
jgi:hypothetical protein